MSARSDMLRVKKVPLFIERTPFNDVWVVERVQYKTQIRERASTRIFGI